MPVVVEDCGVCADLSGYLHRAFRMAPAWRSKLLILALASTPQECSSTVSRRQQMGIP